MKLILHVWRQRNAKEQGRMVRYEAPNVNQEMSFLEMLDVLNEDLIARGGHPLLRHGSFLWPPHQRAEARNIPALS